ncbi:hypothetical protein ACXYMU_13025 [Pontibacter sp. CAU 1760]
MKECLIKSIGGIGIIIGLLIYSLPASAQYNLVGEVVRWPEGKVVLFSGDTIYGPISYFRTEDVVYVQNEDGTLSAYSPVNVKYFVGKEQIAGQTHIFKTLSWDMGRDYSDFKKPTFFEQLNRGGYTLLRRQVPHGQEFKRKSNPYSRANYSEPVTDENALANYQAQVQYYMLLPDGEVVTLRNVRKDMERIFGQKSSTVKAYVKKRDLDYDLPHRLIAIVNYFNTL